MNVEEIIENLCEKNTPCHLNGNCPLKEGVIFLDTPLRQRIQLGCIEIYMHEQNKNLNRNISFSTAFQEWVEKFAQEFSDAYSSIENKKDICPYQLYKQIVSHNPQILQPNSL